MRQWTRWQLARAAVGVAVLVVALWSFAGAAERRQFDPDENLYMWRGRYFGYLFLDHTVAGPKWGDSYWTHTQPMLTNYIVGGWLWARGYRLDKMPPPYDWGKRERENRRQGRVPDRALLAEARAPMVAFAAGAVLLLYLVGCALGRSVAGLTASGLALASPLTLKFLPLAVSEAPLTFFMLLTLLLALVGARRGRAGGLPVGWAVAVGVALGLGLETKLTLVLSLVAILAWGLVVALASGWDGSGPLGSRARRAWTAAQGWVLAVAVAVVVFVAANPHLYPDPLLHTGHLVSTRVKEMRAQQQLLPGDAREDPLERVRFVLRGSLLHGMPMGTRGLPLEAALATVGAGAMLVRAWRGWRRTGRVSVEGLVGLTALAYFGGVSAGLLLAWPHYLIPTFFLGTVLSGLGGAVAVRNLVVLGTAAGGRLSPAARLRWRRVAAPSRNAVPGTRAG